MVETGGGSNTIPFKFEGYVCSLNVAQYWTASSKFFTLVIFQRLRVYLCSRKNPERTTEHAQRNGNNLTTRHGNNVADYTNSQQRKPYKVFITISQP